MDFRHYRVQDALEETIRKALGGHDLADKIISHLGEEHHRLVDDLVDMHLRRVVPFAAEAAIAVLEELQSVERRSRPLLTV